VLDGRAIYFRGRNICPHREAQLSFAVAGKRSSMAEYSGLQSSIANRFATETLHYRTSTFLPSQVGSPVFTYMPQAKAEPGG